MSSMTDKMSETTPGAKEATGTPKQGDRFRCQKCGMELTITMACKCTDPDHVRFECCGQAMKKA